MRKSIVVVGAGISGAVCARQLATRSHLVTVFDKGRAAGGRVSARRTESGHRFDHGASRMDVARQAVRDALAPAVVAGVLGRSGEAYTSPNGMSALCKWLLDGLLAVYSTKIVRIAHESSWTTFDDTGKPYGPFDAVVLAMPPVNAAETVTGIDAVLAETISSVRMLPRWVAMLAFAEKLAHVPNESTVNRQVLRRSMSNTVGDALIVEASQDWRVENVEMDAAAVGQALQELVRPATGGAVPQSVTAHRWRYAFADRPLGRPYLTGDGGLFVCGDWCLGRSIEAAWLSGLAAADAVLLA